jgi:argininosuccinate lyase
MNESRKPWSGRFADATDALVEAYTSSIAADQRLLAADIIGSIAHVRMLGRRRIIPGEDARKIERALQDMLDEAERGEFPLRAELEDVHMNVEAALAERIGPAAGRLHTARSRNDQVATDLRIYVRDAAADAIHAIHDLQEALLALAETNIDAIMPGYTHLQRAQPVLFAHHLLAYVEMLERDEQRFWSAMEMADVMPLGSGALAGSPYPLDREAVAKDLGFLDITRNSVDAVSDRDFVVDYVYAAAMAMTHVSRLAEEIVLWSSAEFGFIKLPDAFATGSSIMPQKKNPDVAELARGRTGRVIGDLVALLTMLKGLPLAYNRDLQEDKPSLFDAEAVLLPTLAVLAEMLPRIEIDRERMRAAASANFSLATDYADYLARKGLPFREAHAVVGKMVRACEERGVGIESLTLEELRAFSPLFAEDARGITLESSVASRDVPGGTAPARVQSALGAARKRLAEARAMLAGDDIEDDDDA